MHRLRGLVAVGIALVSVTASVSCGGDDAGTPSGTGGAGTGGGSGGDGPDAGSGGAGPRLCGNGAVDPGEQCDDGNDTNDDGCENSCRFTCVEGDRRCTNGFPCDGEEYCGPDHRCRPALAPAPDGQICGLTDKCKAGKCEPAEAECGDTLTVSPEECDDGNQVEDDGCGNDCRWNCIATNPERDCTTDDPCPGRAECTADHRCERGKPLEDLTACGDGKACISGACTAEYCSNGVTDPGEECDDGNSADGDGCNKDCRFSCVPGDATRDCRATNACVNDGTCNPTTHQCSPPSVKPSGTACGPEGRKNCVHGNCLDPICGDGVLAQGNESCDDGDAVSGDGCDADCTVSCTGATAATDCPGAPACRAVGCTAGVCTTTADTNQNGQACTVGGESSTCKAGACTSGTCGNGSLEAPEQCDDGNTTPRDGCEANCVPSCSVSADCNDGDPCNGTETCSTVTNGKRCTPGTPLAQGTACGSGKLCVANACRPSFCGDEVVSGNEECEPPNTVACDERCEVRATCNLSGKWALKLTVPVQWGNDAVLAKRDGVIHQWGLMDLVQSPGSTSLSGDVRACGLTIPDFLTAPTLGSEWYGITFANDGFDSGASDPVPMTGSVASLLLGANVSFSSHVILLGVRIAAPANPSGPWPDFDNFTQANGYTAFDSDGNGRSGHSAGAKTGAVPGVAGATFRNPICDISTGIETPLRANLLDLAIRQIASHSGTVSACTTLAGSTTAAIENHITGCRLETGEPCNSDQAKLVDAARPIYTVSNATFLATKLPSGTDCAAVRAAIK